MVVSSSSRMSRCVVTVAVLGVRIVSHPGSGRNRRAGISWLAGIWFDVVDNLVFVPPNRTGPDADRPGEPPGLHSFVDGRARKPGHPPESTSHTASASRTPTSFVARRATKEVYRVAVAARDNSPGKPLKTRAESKAMECPQQDRGTTFRLPQACASSAAPGCRKRQRRSSSGERPRTRPRENAEGQRRSAHSGMETKPERPPTAQADPESGSTGRSRSIPPSISERHRPCHRPRVDGNGPTDKNPLGSG